MTDQPKERLLLPAEVAHLFRVHPRTVKRWADEGRLEYIRTPGGTRRYLASRVNALLAARREKQ